jgi:hypothetical protein
MNKKNVSGFLLVTVVFLFVLLFNKQVCTSANDNDNNKILADSKIKINLDGEIFYGVKKQDKILIPIRRVFEELNCLVLFDRYRDQTGKEISEVSIQNNLCPVYLKVGQQEINFYGGVKKLDLPVEIIDDNSFVEINFLDLMKDIFGASYEINKDNSVSINKKPGQFKIYSDHFYQEIKSDLGKLKGKIAYCVPIIEPEMNSVFIDKINKDYNKILNDFIADAKEQINYDEETFYPKEYYFTFDVSYNKNDLLSIVISGYLNAGGAHPNTMRVSKTFDLKNNKELSLNDILVDGYEKNIYGGFEKFVNAEYDGLSTDTRDEVLESIKKEINSVNFYLADKELVLYFDVYQVAGYAMGYPSVDLKYESNKDLFKIDLAK